MNKQQGGVSRRRFLAAVLALPAAMTQCRLEPVLPQVPVAVEWWTHDRETARQIRECANKYYAQQRLTLTA